MHSAVHFFATVYLTPFLCFHCAFSKAHCAFRECAKPDWYRQEVNLSPAAVPGPGPTSTTSDPSIHTSKDRQKVGLWTVRRELVNENSVERKEAFLSERKQKILKKRKRRNAFYPEPDYNPCIPIAMVSQCRKQNRLDLV